jgi:hypothetical protein
MEPTDPTPDQIKAFAIQGLLANNTNQRNGALMDLNTSKHRLQLMKGDKDKQYFELMGRLVKYEPDQVYSEVLPYAIECGAFYKCESHLLGVMSHIGDYTTADGKKTYKAHFTTYGHFLRKVKDETDLEPISYTGNFLIKSYQDFFVVDRTRTEYKTLEDFIKIKGKEPVWPRNECDRCRIPIQGNGGGACKAENYIFCNACYETEIMEPIKEKQRLFLQSMQIDPEVQSLQSQVEIDIEVEGLKSDEYIEWTIEVQPEVKAVEAKPKRKYVRKAKV